MTSSTAPNAHTTAERLEDDALLAGEAAAGGLRAVEVAAIVVIGLLVCPPLAILLVIVVVPILLIGLVLGLLAAVLTLPYLLVQRLRGEHRGHRAVFARRVRRAAHAVIELAPHRVAAAVRRGEGH